MPRIGGTQLVNNRVPITGLNRDELIDTNIQSQALQPEQQFPEGSVPFGKMNDTFDTGNAGVTSVGRTDDDPRFWAGSTYAGRYTAPFRVYRDGDFFVGDADNYIEWKDGNIIIKAENSNFKTYDAIVDAAGYGDYTDIKEAIDAGNHSIFIRSGSYTLTANITISNDDVSLTGEDKVTTVIDGAYNFVITGDRCEFKDLYFSEIVAGDYCIDASAGSEDLLIQNCKFQDSVNTGGVVHAKGGGFKFLDNDCKIKGGNGSPYYLYTDINTTQGAIIDNNNFDTFDDMEIYLGGGRGSFSNNAVVTDTATNFMVQSAFKMTIFNNYFNNTGASALIAVYASGGASKILSNYFRDSRVSVEESNNIVSDNYFDEPVGVAILVGTDTLRNVISNNVIVSASSHGIHVASDSDGYNIIANNNIHDCVNGIYVERANNTISDNLVRSCDTGGIYIDAANTQCVGNYCEENSGDGIEVNGTAKDEMMLNSNVCRGNTGYGINWNSNPTSSACVGNMLKGNTAGNLNGAAGANSQFSANVTV